MQVTTRKAKDIFLNLQQKICLALEQKFTQETWHEKNSMGELHGQTNHIHNNQLLERACVSVSCIQGDNLPPAASNRHPEIKSGQFEATGLSIVIHPRNPYIPTAHANIRFFYNPDKSWFGGGFDLTPYYGFIEDCQLWHRKALQACQNFGGLELYQKFKTWCDNYFYLPHRQEWRGIGGLFFDDLNWDFETGLNFVESVGQNFIAAYKQILNTRQNTPYADRERQFQLYRRGRYVEFNLLHDRGTKFGLQSQGRTEAILLSLPPLARWEYNLSLAPGSPEAELTNFFLQPRDWLNCSKNEQ